jgi:hypothetical protein
MTIINFYGLMTKQTKIINWQIQIIIINFNKSLSETDIQANKQKSEEDREYFTYKWMATTPYNEWIENTYFPVYFSSIHETFS